MATQMRTTRNKRGGNVKRTIFGEKGKHNSNALDKDQVDYVYASNKFLYHICLRILLLNNILNFK